MTKCPLIVTAIANADHDPVSQLNDFICRFSEPSFDRWNYVVKLSVHSVPITRPILESMIEFMNLPLAKYSTGTTTDEEKKWIWVIFYDCRFDQDCTLDDIRRLFMAIAHRAAEVYIDISSDILSRFLSSCHHDDQMEVSLLYIEQHVSLSAEQFTKLGDMIQRSIHLKTFHLCLPMGDGAHEVFAALASAIELRKLSIHGGWNTSERRKDLGDLVAGKNGDGPLIRLLRNPHNQLKELSLHSMGLKDHHLSAVLQSIPSTHVEHLDFSCNLIQLPGMLEFGNLLPKMKYLKKLVLHDYPWRDWSADDRHTIGSALVQGMMGSMSIQETYGVAWRTPQDHLLRYYLALNHAGRRIVQLSQPVADGLWPLILARVGPKVYWFGKYSNNYQATASVIYYFLQNCPRIVNGQQCRPP